MLQFSFGNFAQNVKISRAADAGVGKFEFLLLDTTNQPIRQADLGADRETNSTANLECYDYFPKKVYESGMLQSSITHHSNQGGSRTTYCKPIHEKKREKGALQSPLQQHPPGSLINV